MFMSTEIIQRPMPRINDPAPQFTTPNTTHGPFSLSDLKDKWVILFSHPADFTPVCTTEFIEFAKRYEDFKKRNVEIVGLSVDSIFAHLGWVRNIEQNFGVKVPFRVIADRDMKVANLFGMIQPNESDTATVRAVFFIAPEGKTPAGQPDPQRIRAIIYYPLSLGRNMEEIIRVVDALQANAKYAVATPVNWKPGDMAIIPPPTTKEAAEARKGEVEKVQGEYTDWYFSKKKVG
jgi:peroxiredoxin (alkyl hydroperoxide reductase subunit C)